MSQSEVGKNVYLEITYVDGGGFSNIVRSEPTSTIENINNQPQGSITGNFELLDGNVLDANQIITISDIDGLPTDFTFDWIAENQTLSSQNQLYLTQDDVGKVLSLDVSYKDLFSTSEKVTFQLGKINNTNDLPNQIGLSVSSENGNLDRHLGGYTDSNGLTISKLIQIPKNTT